jgi:RsiW-degrading membrane proteinase PrsW (M82 family)
VVIDGFFMIVLNMNFLLGALGLLLSTGFWLYFILKKDKIEREPLVTVIWVGLTGGIISVIFAIISGGIFSAATGLGFISRSLPIPDAAALALFVGFSEEFFKCTTAMVLIQKLKEFDEPVDGIIYAMVVSLGFALFENIGYVVQHGPIVLISRTFLSVPGHLGFGALWGTGLAVAKFRYPEKSIFFVVMPYMAASACFHALFDFCLFIFLPFKIFVAMSIVVLLWIYASRKAKFLVAHSPFLP